MNQPAHAFATYDDLMEVPPHLVAEIVGGSLYTHPRPAPRHALASSSLGGELNGLFQRGKGGPGGWWILDEPELHFGADVVVPDIAGWRRERLPRLPEENGFEVAPDWVCEVLSPSTERFDRVEKMPVYAAAGVGHLWLVDPLLRTLEVFSLHEGKWLLEELPGDDSVNAPPFAEVALELAALWEDGEPAS